MQKKEDPYFQCANIRKGDKRKQKLQQRKTMELMEKAGPANYTGSCGIPELSKFQHALPEYQIKTKNSTVCYCTRVNTMSIIILYDWLKPEEIN